MVDGVGATTEWAAIPTGEVLLGSKHGGWVRVGVCSIPGGAQRSSFVSSGVEEIGCASPQREPIQAHWTHCKNRAIGGRSSALT